jgi:nonsense-mediated mRNA decay protein 3
MFAASHHTSTQIPCCLCGTMIFPNEANQCGTCLAQQFDLRDVLQKNGEPHIVHQCRQCRRFARTETLYEFCELESPQLLTICLKKIPALLTSKSGTSSKLQIIDAIWVWTEPHSMRLKIRLTMRTEMESVQVKQRVMVEYHIHWKMCSGCNREYTNRTWGALVQLRQKRDLGANRKGLAAMEMALRRNKEIRKKVLKIDACKNGLDFYFLNLPQAQSFAQFLAKLAPMRIKMTQKLVSADVKNNTGKSYTILGCIARTAVGRRACFVSTSVSLVFGPMQMAGFSFEHLLDTPHSTSHHCCN